MRLHDKPSNKEASTGDKIPEAQEEFNKIVEFVIGEALDVEIYAADG